MENSTHSSELWAREASAYLRSHFEGNGGGGDGGGGDSDASNPFFMLLALNAAHSPLQARDCVGGARRSLSIPR